MPAAAMFSYGPRSKCADLSELLLLMVHFNGSARLNVDRQIAWEYNDFIQQWENVFPHNYTNYGERSNNEKYSGGNIKKADG